MYLWMCAIIISLMIYSVDRNDWLSQYLSLSRFMIGVVSLIHMASLFLLHSLSITFAPSQSMMQLFLSVWSVIADLCSTVADSLLFPGNHFLVMFSTSFLCSASLVPHVLPVSQISARGNMQLDFVVTDFLNKKHPNDRTR